MADTPTKTHYGIVAVIIIAAIVLYFGFRTGGWFRSSAVSHKDGEACTTKDSYGISVSGIYKNGICVATPVGPGNNGGSNSTTRTTYMPVNPLNNL